MAATYAARDLPVTIHSVKCNPACFAAIDDGRKPFEIRKDDRFYQTGDVLELVYFDEAIEALYLSRSVSMPRLQRRITWILHGGRHGIESGFVALGLGAVPGYEPQAIGLQSCDPGFAVEPQPVLPTPQISASDYQEALESDGAATRFDDAMARAADFNGDNDRKRIAAFFRRRKLPEASIDVAVEYVIGRQRSAGQLLLRNLAREFIPVDEVWDVPDNWTRQYIYGLLVKWGLPPFALPSQNGFSPDFVADAGREPEADNAAGGTNDPRAA